MLSNYGGWRRLFRVPWTAGDQANQSQRKSNLNIHWKDWCWSWNCNTWATWCKELTHWKRPWCWERLKAEGEGDNRRQDGLMASPTQSTWVWANSGRWWRTGKLACCISWGQKGSDVTEGLINNERLHPLDLPKDKWQTETGPAGTSFSKQRCYCLSFWVDNNFQKAIF